MAEYTHDDEQDLTDIVAAARLRGMVPGTGRFSRAILGAGYRRTEDPSPDWELRGDFASPPAAVAAAGSRSCGCRWHRRGDGAVVFTSRCEQHEPMCRHLEPWELELVGNGSEPSGGAS